ncbi:adenylyltransferase/cytidyltransferase family protein [Actinomadura parmotrematis]|uniref:ethanolamine-phosphate cytidylyltransferase n=1 Tax=Actinomadura parmotrematis TaxID=2864039 RepID=A0ABS7FPV7_9ACTN|nr:adenylyltransferase/cytidyltransferase family protein [Actinomadura parmotrematis]MBW8481602.1 adenylyltransferase/cytidyltransferase family protein [Actinomadura parmotrematis]
MGAVTGFAPGVFDLFHVGHLDALGRAAAACDRLVAGVCTDELAAALFGAPPVVPLIERLEIVGACRHVAAAVPLDTADLRAAHAGLGFGVVFTGWRDAPPPAALDLTGTGARVHAFTDLARTRSAVLRAALIGTDTAGSSVA